MQRQWSRLALYAAIGITVVMLLFPPFIINNGPVEYGFLFSGPPSVRQAYSQMSALGGQAGRDMASGMIHYSVDAIRLVLQLAAVWIAWFALRKTVLKPTTA
jgi:hypothetical protein